MDVVGALASEFIDSVSSSSSSSSSSSLVRNKHVSSSSSSSSCGATEDDRTASRTSIVMAQAADPSQLSRHPNNNNNMNDPANVELLLVKSTSRAPPPKEIHFIPGNEEEEEAASVLGGDGASVLMMRPSPEYYSSSAPAAEALNAMTPATATPTIVESDVPPQSCSLSSPNHRLESIPPSPLTVVSVEETATHDTTNDNIARSCVPEQPSSSSSSPGPSITTPLVVTPMESKETTTVVPTTTVFPETHSSTTATTAAVSAVPVIALTTTTNVTEPPAPAAVAAPPRPVVTQEEPTKNLVTSLSSPPPPTTGANAPLALTEPNAPRSENTTATITTTTSLFEQLQQETQERALEEESLLVPAAMESSSSMNVLPLTAILVPPPTQDETETKKNQVVIETSPSNPVPVVEAAPTTNPVPPPTMTTTTAVTLSDTAFGTPQQDHTQMNISSSNENKNDDDQTDIAIAADETMTDRTAHISSTILPAQPSPVEPNNEAPPVMSVDEPPTRTTTTTTTASPSTPLVQESVVDVVEPGQEEPIVDPPTKHDVAPSTPERAPKVTNEQAAEEDANVQDSAVPAIPLTESTLSGGDVIVQHEEEISTEPATTRTLQSLRAKPPLPEPETRLSTKDDNEAAPTPHLTPVDLTATRQVALFEPSVLGEYSEISVPPSTLGLMPRPPPPPPPQDHSVSNELVAPAETTALSPMSSPITSEPLTAPHTNDTTSSSAPSVTLATNTEQPQANGLSNQDLVTVPVPPDQPQVAHSTPQPEMVAVPSLETASPPLESAPPQSGGAVGASTLETVPQSEVAIGASTLETVPPEVAVLVSNLETVPQMQQRDFAVPESPPVTQPETTANAQVETLPSTDMELPQSQIASMNTNDGAAVETLTDTNRMIVPSLPTAPQDNGQACPDMISSTLMHYANSATSAVASARASATAVASTAVGPDSAVDCSFTSCMAENVAASAKANLEAWAKQPPAIQGQNMGTGQDQDKGTVEGQEKGTEGTSGKAPSDMILGCVPKRILSMDNDDDDDAKPPACPTLPLPSYLQAQGQTVKPMETRDGVEAPATVLPVSEQTQPKQTPQDPVVEETKNNNDQHPATTEATQETFAVTNMVQSLPWLLSELSPPSSPTRSAAKPPTSPIVCNDLDIANYAVIPIELPEGPTTTTDDEASSTRAARELDRELFHPVLAAATATAAASSPSQSLKQQEPVGTCQDPQGRDSSDPLSDNDDDEKKEEELTAPPAIASKFEKTASKFEKTAVKIGRRRRDLKSDIAKHQQELERIRARMSQLRTQFAVHVVALSEIGEVMQDLDEEELAKLEERTELLRTLAEARKIKNKKTAAAKGTNAKTVLSAIVTPNEHYGGPNSKEPRFTMMDIPQINTMLMEGFDNDTSKDDSSATSRTAWESFEYFLQCGDLTGALAGLDSSKPF